MPTEDAEYESEPQQVGKKATVKVALLMEYHVEVEMPFDGDAGEQADLELWLQERYDDYDEKDVVHSEIVEEEPLLVEDPEMEDYPSHV